MSLRCEDVELLLLQGDWPDEARAHVLACEKCQAFEKDLGQVLELSRLPELSGAERAQLVGLAPRTLAAVRAREGRGALLRRGLSLAMAAGLGALVATVALRAGPQPQAPAPRPQVSDAALDFPLVVSVDDDGMQADSVDDDVEISWPNPNEGEVP